MKALLLLLVVIVISTNLYSQNLDTVWIQEDTLCDDYFESIDMDIGVLASDGSIYLCGVKNNGPDEDVYVIKYNSNGDTVWTRSFEDGLTDEWALKAIETYDNNILILEIKYEDSNPITGLIKIDPEGNIIWREKYFSISNAAAAIDVIETEDHNFVLTGKYNISAQNSALFILKTDSLGDSLSFSLFGEDSYDYGSSVVEMDDGGLIITGFKSDNDSTLYNQFWYMRLDSLDNIIWDYEIPINARIDFAK